MMGSKIFLFFSYKKKLIQWLHKGKTEKHWYILYIMTSLGMKHLMIVKVRVVLWQTSLDKSGDIDNK